ncbi:MULTISPECIES: DUF1648 domain-containing protein [Sporosarcina]|uniref:DUF1648 domain-containing protein n=1 Tax=Sporosarcina contaminans TaxID=633403 RepID=A0ABW3U118_9BACL
MNNRPMMTIKRSRFAKGFDTVTLLAYLAGIIYLIFMWGQLPDEVPGHYNGAGEVDRWGSKWELILLPVIALFLFAFMAFMERHPEWHNYMNLNENNIEFQYKNSMLLLNVLKNECVLFFTYLHFKTVQVALGKAASLGIGFLPIFIGITIGSLIYFAIRSFKNK